MQKIKLDVFKSWFDKDLSGKEIDFLIALSAYQDERGTVYGVYYAQMMEDAHMSVQTFYNCKESLAAKGVIYSEKGEGDYDITIVGNDFSVYTQEDYNKGNVKYLKMNSSLFRCDPNFRKLKPKQKLLVMDIYNIQNAGKPRAVQAYQIKRENFINKYTELLNVTGRTLQKYLKMLKLYFSICLKDGKYFFTLRQVFRRQVVQENTVAMEHLLHATCRRHKITDPDKKEQQDVLNILLNKRKEILHNSVNIDNVMRRMIETINAKILNPRKWKRRLKASLFMKILKEEIA